MPVATAQYAGILPSGLFRTDRRCPQCGVEAFVDHGTIITCINNHIWTHPDMTAFECCKKKDAVIQGLAERTAAQSELLGKRAEKPAEEIDWPVLKGLAKAIKEERESAADRKTMPVGTGVIDYFPLALLAIANCSYVGNEQHNPGTELHWDRTKSTDEADAMIRHFIERGKVDSDGIRHSTKVAWRALALLQKELEQAK
jgi:hypothetical protein